MYKTGSLHKTDEINKSRASATVEGITTLKPGTCVNHAWRA